MSISGWSLESLWGKHPSSRAIAPCRKPSKTQNVTTKILQRPQDTVWHSPWCFKWQRAHPAICAEKDACMIGRIFSPTLEEAAGISTWHQPSFSCSKYILPRTLTWCNKALQKCINHGPCLKPLQKPQNEKQYNHLGVWDTTAMHWGRYQAKGTTAFVLMGCFTRMDGKPTQTQLQWLVISHGM